jgi:hypothetical protein
VVFVREFPYLFVGAFIEAVGIAIFAIVMGNFPSFSEGLSLRRRIHPARLRRTAISLPFGKGFH